MVKSDAALWKLTRAIVAGDAAGVSGLLTESPSLTCACFHTGATRQTARKFYFEQIERYIIAGDTALHFAAAAYQTEVVRTLIAGGASVHARNRFGDQPLHAAAVGHPGSRAWNPAAQTATIICMMEAGADPNAFDKRGVTPLHRAVRTRCAAAVQILLERGADPAGKNKNGSTPMLLATRNTGRGGSGSPEAKSEQLEILRLLECWQRRRPAH
jgi:hypothetical protein